MSDDYETLRAVAQRLEAELSQNVTYIRLQAVRRALDVWNQGQVIEATMKPAVLPARGSRTTAVIEAAVAYLREKGGRAQSGELVAALNKRGIAIGGKKPSATMASYLSHNALFDNKQGEGYGLLEWSLAAETRHESETPDSSQLSGVPKLNGALPLSA